MMGGVSSETFWASYKYEIQILIHCCILFDFLCKVYYDARILHEHQAGYPGTSVSVCYITYRRIPEGTNLHLAPFMDLTSHILGMYYCTRYKFPGFHDDCWSLLVIFWVSAPCGRYLFPTFREDVLPSSSSRWLVLVHMDTETVG